MPALFAKLPESDPGVRRHRSAANLALSVVVHAALVTFAVVATLRANEDTPAPKPDFPEVVWPITRPEPITEPHRDSRDVGGQTSAAPLDRPVPPKLPAPRFVFDLDSLRDPTLRTVHGDTWPSTNSQRVNGVASGPGGTGGPLTAPDVEVQAVMLAAAPPRYPAMLRESGVEGRVVVRFVVDTTGRVERPSVAIVSSSHELFTATVRAALPTLRFRPASACGRLVRQLVELPFEFALER